MKISKNSWLYKVNEDFWNEVSDSPFILFWTSIPAIVGWLSIQGWKRIEGVDWVLISRIQGFIWSINTAFCFIVGLLIQGEWLPLIKIGFIECVSTYFAILLCIVLFNVLSWIMEYVFTFGRWIKSKIKIKIKLPTITWTE